MLKNSIDLILQEAISSSFHIEEKLELQSLIRMYSINVPFSLPQAIEELHENAIYFISGKRYKVKKLNYDVNDANQPYYAELIFIPTDYPYYTRAMVSEWPNVIQIYEQKKVFGVDVKYCSLKIRKKVMGTCFRTCTDRRKHYDNRWSFPRHGGRISWFFGCDFHS